MKKTIICNITMQQNNQKCVYQSDDLSLPSSNREVYYPINAYLEKTLAKYDEVKVLLLIKKDAHGNYQENVEEFVTEINEINKEIGAKIEIKYLETDFTEKKSVHEQLMSRIINEIEDGSHILADITYGPKDLPIVLFAALNFADKFLDCEIDNIIYGFASFVDGKPTDTKLCDMIPLYYLNNVTNTINCKDSNKARKMLETLLSL